jgi:hypothetical protein
MASNPRHYEVTVEPDGKWYVRLIRGDISTTMAKGEAKGEDCMYEAEREARAWVNEQLDAIREAMDYRDRCRVFQMPATVARMRRNG